MSPKETAYIVERLAVRFMAMVADYERKLVEHRDSFGARTSADAKIIEGLRRELFMLTGLNDKLIVDREEAWKERDGLLTQVQDMRVEIERLRIEAAKCKAERDDLYQREGIGQKRRMDVEDERDGLLTQVQDMRAEIERLQWENKTMHKDAEDGYAAAIKVLGDPVALSKERDALRAEVAALQERLRASIARGDFAQMEVAALKSQTPKHPVKVGTWVRRTKLPGDQSPVGIVKQVTSIRCDGDSYGFADGDFWSVDNCEPCAHQHPAQDGQWVRRTVASGMEPVGTMIQVQRSRTLHSEYVTRGAQVVPWAHCEPCDPPATHDTVQGKAAAESAVRTEPVADEIKFGDLVEVVGRSAPTFATIGTRGIVVNIHHTAGYVDLDNSMRASIKDVRKVTT